MFLPPQSDSPTPHTLPAHAHACPAHPSLCSVPHQARTPFCSSKSHSNLQTTPDLTSFSLFTGFSILRAQVSFTSFSTERLKCAHLIVLIIRLQLFGDRQHASHIFFLLLEKHHAGRQCYLFPADVSSATAMQVLLRALSELGKNLGKRKSKTDLCPLGHLASIKGPARC